MQREIKYMSQRKREKESGTQRQREAKRVTKGEERMETKIVPATRNEGKTHSVCSLAALGCSIVRRPTIV